MRQVGSYYRKEASQDSNVLTIDKLAGNGWLVVIAGGSETETWRGIGSIYLSEYIEKLTSSKGG